MIFIFNLKENYLIDFENYSIYFFEFIINLKIFYSFIIYLILIIIDDLLY